MQSTATRQPPTAPRLPSPTTHSAVAEQARRALRSDGHLRHCPIACEYRQGTLVLHGRVPSFYLKQVAQTAVRDVSGIEQIVNGIEVVPGSDQPGRDEAASLDSAAL